MVVKLAPIIPQELNDNMQLLAYNLTVENVFFPYYQSLRKKTYKPE